jgi:hypothetical protein
MMAAMLDREKVKITRQKPIEGKVSLETRVFTIIGGQ